MEIGPRLAATGPRVSSTVEDHSGANGGPAVGQHHACAEGVAFLQLDFDPVRPRRGPRFEVPNVGRKSLGSRGKEVAAEKGDDVIDAAIPLRIGRSFAALSRTDTAVAEPGSGDRPVIGPGDMDENRAAFGLFVERKVGRHVFLVGTEDDVFLQDPVPALDRNRQRLVQRQIVELEPALPVGRDGVEGRTPVPSDPAFFERQANLGKRSTPRVAHDAANPASGRQREAELGGRPRRRGGDGDRLGGVTVGSDLEQMLARRQAFHDGDPLGIGPKSPLEIGAQQANRGPGQRTAVSLRLHRDANATGRGGLRVHCGSRNAPSCRPERQARHRTGNDQDAAHHAVVRPAPRRRESGDRRRANGVSGASDSGDSKFPSQQSPAINDVRMRRRDRLSTVHFTNKSSDNSAETTHGGRRGGSS